MKSGKHVVLILVAITLGALATYLSNRLIQQEVTTRIGNKTEKKVDVIVAAIDLEAGALLDSSVLAIRQIPEPYVTSDSVLPDAVAQIESGRLERAVKSGEQLQFSDLKRAADQAFSRSLKTGSRALTFSVDEVNSLSGLLSPDDRIDMLLVYRKGEHDLSMPLLQNIRVLATGRELHSMATASPSANPDQQYSNITLELSPLEARKLTLAQAAGARITALLRNPMDQVPITSRSASFNDLVVNGTMPSLHPVTRGSYGIAMYVGGVGSDLKPSMTRVANGQSSASAALQQLTSLLHSGQGILQKPESPLIPNKN